MTRLVFVTLGTLLTGAVWPAAPAAFAQTARPAPAFEGSAGSAAFLDPGDFDHLVVGGAVRLPLTRRLTVGPEIVYMAGPRTDRDVIVNGVLWVDLIVPHETKPARVVPYVLVGGGFFTHSQRGFSSTEGSLTGGGGLRVWVSDRVYVAPEFRLGWEPHVRAMVHVGLTGR